MFPWTENIIEYEQIVTDSQTSSTSNHSTSELIDTPLIKETDILEHVNTEPAMEFKFTDVMERQICLPKLWVVQRYTNAVTFYTSSYIETGDIDHTVTMKEVILRDDMMLRINIIGQRVQLHTINLPEAPISSLEALQDVLFTIDGLNICSGLWTSKEESDIVESKVARKDNTGTRRHMKCQLILFDSIQCEFCAKLKKILRRKKLREERKDSTNTIQVTLHSATGKQKLQQLRNKMYRVTKAKKRCEESVAKIKAKLLDCNAQITKLSEQTVEEHMKTLNVPKNQQDAVRQIFAAAKCKNSKGRRYSEQWLLLCMLMHMRSPCGYEFLRDNNILPLPCVRTIRR